MSVRDPGVTDERPDTVWFFVPGGTDLERLASMNPDDDWRLMKRQTRWTVQTCLRLAAAGHDTRLTHEVPETGIVVFHAGQKKDLLRRVGRRSRAVLVGIRGDRREPLIADFEVLQNGLFADGKRRFFIPYWPQPGLLPRDESRGAKIEVASFKGFDRNLHPDLRSPRWAEFLRSRGIRWRTDSMKHSESERGDLAVNWNDYSDVDLVVAMRPEDAGSATSKPATKLYNAWLAGVPALLGPEYAFRELRRSELDFVEITSLEDAMQAVDRLQSDPGLYVAMISNGQDRAREFTVEAILERWVRLLWGPIAAEALRRASSPPRLTPLRLRLLARRLARAASRRPAR